ncbi:MAG: SlyX family protein [Micavibrio sp.]|nr:SlyX family protein [Micavibrio sp.]
MSDEKITRLEEALMYQEEQINTLHEMVTRQWDEIDMLKKHIRELQGTVAEVTENQTLSTAEQSARDKPPHY